MLSTIEGLVRHKAWANTRLLHAIQQHPAAAEDVELRKMLHHILVSNRFWLLTILGRNFVREDEMQIPSDLATIIERFNEIEHLESEWLSKAELSDLDCTLETRSSRLGIDVSVQQAILQICMHTQGHRAQCATRLRALGGTPPGTDYVLWIKEPRS
ncbi:DinB family protein [Telmatobacter sp. DSM 110680]|uniref:DinB family protein n=1 Tax=Telmatobacter sp. DSM 110680 TaxID=3036704 RepID=A0AAU7DNR0_9BACT